MKRRWLLLLLLPPVAVTLYPLLFTPWNDGISSLFLVFCLLPAALGFGLGALLRFLCRDGWRWAVYTPLALEVVPLALAWEDISTPGFLSGLMAMFCLMGAICYLLGWGASWAFDFKKE